jgi:hypothetical protein
MTFLMTLGVAIELRSNVSARRKRHVQRPAKSSDEKIAPVNDTQRKSASRKYEAKNRCCPASREKR